MKISNIDPHVGKVMRGISFQTGIELFNQCVFLSLILVVLLWSHDQTWLVLFEYCHQR